MLTLGQIHDARLLALFVLKRVPKTLRVNVFQFHDPLRGFRKFMTMVLESAKLGKVWERQILPECKVSVMYYGDTAWEIIVYRTNSNWCMPLSLTELWNALARPESIILKGGKRFPYPNELTRAVAQDFE